MTAHFAPERAEPRSLWRLLRRHLWPRDARFFPLFDRQAGYAVESLRALVQLLADPRDPGGKLREIESLEKRADATMAEVRALLARALFPPFARGTVLDLANRIDDILDLAEDAAESVHLYHATTMTSEAQRLAQLAVDAAEALHDAVRRLERLERPREVLRLCQRVDELEAQADHVMRAAMSRLFRDETDARQLVKFKAIYEQLEGLTDNCKAVANALEAIVLRHA
jgi:predicted phosphate transport protein (TIGR00153 family)